MGSAIQKHEENLKKLGRIEYVVDSEHIPKTAPESPKKTEHRIWQYEDHSFAKLRDLTRTVEKDGFTRSGMVLRTPTLAAHLRSDPQPIVLHYPLPKDGKLSEAIRQQLEIVSSLNVLDLASGAGRTPLANLLHDWKEHCDVSAEHQAAKPGGIIVISVSRRGPGSLPMLKFELDVSRGYLATATRILGPKGQVLREIIVEPDWDGIAGAWYPRKIVDSSYGLKNGDIQTTFFVHDLKVLTDFDPAQFSLKAFALTDGTDIVSYDAEGNASYWVSVKDELVPRDLFAATRQHPATAPARGGNGD